MYEIEFKRIVDASRKNSLTFFVGAGVSALSKAPSWKALIDDICHKIGYTPQKSYSSDEYLRIPQIFYYSIRQDNDAYYDFIKEHLSPFPLVPNTVHKELMSFNPSSLITTNFDELLEDAAIQYCQSFKSVACDSEVPSINGDRFILKVHGDIRHRNIVFREEDYLNYSENFKLIETLLKSIFSTNTVVFIGYGLNDYNIKLILNWAKALLKDNFNKPIFIYTDDMPLTPENLLYQESKGLSVIEYEKLGTHFDEYLPRYLSVIEAIKKSAALTYDGKTEFEAFEVTYELLKPLDKLAALRISDITDTLSNNLRISSNGAISSDPEKTPAIKYLFKLNSLPQNEYDALPISTKEKYQLILRVFSKAQIRVIGVKHKWHDFIGNAASIPFSDSLCLTFNYKEMYAFAKKKYRDMQSNYRKAFYLSRLQKFDEAFFLFTQIANEAFKSGEYILYYFAEVNRINLYKIIKNIHGWSKCYDLDRLNDLSPGNDTTQIFVKLPIEFQKQYNTFKDLHSANMLYEYSYEAFLDGERLRNAIESHSVEFGMTSSIKVTCRINESLHFSLGNHLVIDEFSEYRNTIKNLMSLLVYKYSTQTEKILHEQVLPAIEQNEVIFDQLDFYCFIEFFESKDLVKLFRKHHLETIEFQHMDEIEASVCSIFDYYEIALKRPSNNIDILHLQREIKTCLTLLRYVDISQSLADKLCIFIFKYDFRDILIDDKVLFLDRQIANRHKYSNTTAKIVEDKLIWYIDSHIAALEAHKHFDVLSAHSSINYCDLIRYIAPKDVQYFSRKLSIRVSKIISGNLSELFPQIVHHYWAYISIYQRRKVVAWAKEKLDENFRFDFLTLLLECNARIETCIISSLKKYLNETVENSSKAANDSGVMSYPKKDPYEDLIQVGYWCLIGDLPKKFSEFVGYSDAFDFYYLYKRFDFNKFQPAWLLNLYPHTLTKISKSRNVREQIRSIIAKTLNDDKLDRQDKERLQDILTRHFCW